MNSRARFSLGLPALLLLPSSHSSIAGSTTIARARSVKLPSACSRWVRFCASISRGLRTFCSLVAKWPCQNQVSRSTDARSAATIRSSHQPTAWAAWACICLRACCFAAWSAFLPGLSGGGPRSGIGVAAAPASGPVPSSRSRVSAKPAVEIAGPRPEAEPVVQPPDGRAFGEDHHAADPAARDRVAASGRRVS